MLWLVVPMHVEVVVVLVLTPILGERLMTNDISCAARLILVENRYLQIVLGSREELNDIAGHWR